MNTKIAIIGAGSMAREHIRVFGAIPKVTVAGIYSRTESKAAQLAQEFSIPLVTSSIDELYEKTKADLVIVTVPELAANKIAKACFCHPWAVLMEKPAGYDLNDAQDIHDASKKAGGPVLVGFNRRFYSSTKSALADMQGKKERRFIRIEDQQSFAEARRYKHPEEVVEKFMYANSIHMIDLFRVFGRGDITNVKAISPWKGESSDVVLIHLEFESGDTGLYQGLWQGPGPWVCSISTPSRRWVLQPLEKLTYQNANERQVQEMPLDTVDKEYKAGFYRQAEEVLKCLRGEPHQMVTMNDSLATMRLIHQMFGI